MCGLTGFWSARPESGADALAARVRAMAATLHHRGPDDGGEWVDAPAGLALGFRRLAILDLSPAGHQPMPSASGRYVLAFNGEVYNHGALRRELESRGAAPAFRGHSDTETMLAAFEAWGVAPAVRRFNGMFAFALWDRTERTLTLGRDRLGEKPLYYGRSGGTLLFGSELKALRAHPDFQNAIDRDALALMLRHNYIPAPYSIYKGIRKLPPGTLLTLGAPGDVDTAEPVPYWSAREAAECGLAHPFTGSDDEAIGALDVLLRDAVRMRMAADVPLGAFLSGGVDSSTVVALMQAQSDRPVRTFSIGFHEDAFNEAQHARAVAEHLQTDHTELYLSASDAQAVIPRLPALYDEPFADSSQIPTLLVSELARRHVTVSLSGDGGDELFAGYTRYLVGQGLWNKMARTPRTLRFATANALAGIPPRTWDALFEKAGSMLPARARHSHPADKIARLAEMLRVDSPEAVYRSLVSHWKNPAALVPGAREPVTALTDPARWANLPDFTQRMAFLDTITYLPDDILVKVDRASMGVSLEARVPLLDHRLVEFAATLPMGFKIRNNTSKWLLRQVLYRYVPPRLIERPKMGFGVPLGDWLRGPLRDWAEDLLDAHRLCDGGFFHPAPIRQKWDEHLSGRQNNPYYLWDVLMFQAWLAEHHGR